MNIKGGVIRTIGIPYGNKQYIQYCFDKKKKIKLQNGNTLIMIMDKQYVFKTYLEDINCIAQQLPTILEYETSSANLFESYLKGHH